MHCELYPRLEWAHRCDQSVLITALSLAASSVIERGILFEALSKSFLWLIPLISVDHSESTAGDDDKHIGKFFVRNVLSGCLCNIELSEVHRATEILLGFLIVCEKVMLLTLLFLKLV